MHGEVFEIRGRDYYNQPGLQTAAVDPTTGAYNGYNGAAWPLKNAIRKFRGEYEKFSEELDTLGNRLESTSKQFQVVSTTRSRQLGRVIDQIDSQHVLDTPDEKLLD